MRDYIAPGLFVLAFVTLVFGGIYWFAPVPDAGNSVIGEGHPMADLAPDSK